MSKVQDWRERYGVAHFTYRGQAWTAVEVDGNTMGLEGLRLSISGAFGDYPTPGIAERVLDDFDRCVGLKAEGRWELQGQHWVQVSTGRLGA